MRFAPFCRAMAAILLTAAVAGLTTGTATSLTVLVLLGSLIFAALALAAESSWVRTRWRFLRAFDRELEELQAEGATLLSDVINVVSPTDDDRDSFLRRMRTFDEKLWRAFERHAPAKGHVLRPLQPGWVTDDQWRPHVQNALQARVNLLGTLIMERA